MTIVRTGSSIQAAESGQQSWPEAESVHRCPPPSLPAVASEWHADVLFQPAAKEGLKTTRTFCFPPSQCAALKRSAALTAASFTTPPLTALPGPGPIIEEQVAEMPRWASLCLTCVMS